jgi:hypothetical protein
MRPKHYHWNFKVTDSQCNNAPKDKFKEENLMNFYKHLPKETYPKGRSCVHGFISVIASAYLHGRENS